MNASQIIKKSFLYTAKLAALLAIWWVLLLATHIVLALPFVLVGVEAEVKSSGFFVASVFAISLGGTVFVWKQFDRVKNIQRSQNSALTKFFARFPIRFSWNKDGYKGFIVSALRECRKTYRFYAAEIIKRYQAYATERKKRHQAYAAERKKKHRAYVAEEKKREARKLRQKYLAVQRAWQRDLDTVERDVASFLNQRAFTEFSDMQSHLQGFLERNSDASISSSIAADLKKAAATNRKFRRLFAQAKKLGSNL